ncbi:MAG: phytanoyl-CoA dioxygenase family protein [Verrucomicrobia bacterium]|nr:phytanoyl-CoA dioxygenase family protein [Verrucomicrobiota bacterium]
MSSTDNPLPAPTEVGSIGVYQLKRLWARRLASRAGRGPTVNPEDRIDRVVMDALGVGLEQYLSQLLRTGASFDEFEKWILETTGGVEPEQVARINAAVLREPAPEATRQRLAAVEAAEPVLTAGDLAFWEANGYVVVHDAVPEATRRAAEQAIWRHLEASPDDPESWYRKRNQGIMVQFFQHPAFTANRRSLRLHKAFAQLWGTADLWVTTDRAGFNVPERPGWLFPGPDLHWDVSLHQPIPFGTQGILYLTDTPAEQGAFTCVPGFQHRVGPWLAGLPPGTNPRHENLHALGSQPIAGRAGDLVIWHHALPHGARPNRGTRPRLVQYIDMYPAWETAQDTWV